MPGATRCPAVASSPPPTPTEIARIHTSEVSELNRVRLSLLAVALLTAVSACTFGGRSAKTTPAPWPGDASAIRGVYRHDTRSNGFTLEANAGVNTFDATPYPDDLRAVTPHGVKG